tara:strand:- start:66 stop:632 length:567 start_codon:yes stop_codon:yes gene_type:complete
MEFEYDASTTVEDISFYKQFSKWQQVVNLDSEVGATLNAIEMLRGTDDVSEEEMSAALRRALINLFIQLEPQLKRRREHVGDYWNGPLDLGTLDLPVKGVITNLDNADSIKLTGLKDIVELPDPILYLTQVEVKELGIPSRVIDRRKEYHIPLSILVRAYRYFIEWEGKVGLGLSLQTDEDAFEGWID